MSDLGDYGLSLDIEKAVRIIARQEVDAARPATRMAQVAAIDTVGRTLTVTFIGETEQVKVPYTSQVPANLGQYVRIGGTTHDRYVEDIIGTTNTEARVERAEAEAVRSGQKAYCELLPASDFNVQAVQRAPLVNIAQNPAGVPMLKNMIASAGYATVQIEGTYRYFCKAQPSNARNQGVSAWTQLVTAGGTQVDVDFMQVDLLGGSGEYGQGTQVIMSGVVYMYAGDRLCMNLFASNNNTMRAAGTKLVMELIDPAATPA